MTQSYAQYKFPAKLLGLISKYDIITVMKAKYAKTLELISPYGVKP